MFYLTSMVLVSVAPFGGLTLALNNITVLELRLDYLVHALLFMFLVLLQLVLILIGIT